MNRAFLVIFVPAILVGVAYVFVFRYAGLPLRPFPLIMAIGGFLVAIWLVRGYERRKRRAKER